MSAAAQEIRGRFPALPSMTSPCVMWRKDGSPEEEKFSRQTTWDPGLMSWKEGVGEHGWRWSTGRPALATTPAAPPEEPADWEEPVPTPELKDKTSRALLESGRMRQFVSDRKVTVILLTYHLRMPLRAQKRSLAAPPLRRPVAAAAARRRPRRPRQKG